MNEATYLSFGGTRGGLAIDYMVPELLVSQSDVSLRDPSGEIARDLGVYGTSTSMRNADIGAVGAG